MMTGGDGEAPTMNVIFGEGASCNPEIIKDVIKNLEGEKDEEIGPRRGRDGSRRKRRKSKIVIPKKATYDLENMLNHKRARVKSVKQISFT